jgi:hypothetical protein
MVCPRLDRLEYFDDARLCLVQGFDVRHELLSHLENFRGFGSDACSGGGHDGPPFYAKGPERSDVTAGRRPGGTYQLRMLGHVQHGRSVAHSGRAQECAGVRGYRMGYTASLLARANPSSGA